jgi:hypothetical protein
MNGRDIPLFQSRKREDVDWGVAAGEHNSVFDSPRCTMLQLEERSGKAVEDVKHGKSNQRSTV